jgi:O-antigen ligase
MAIAASLLGGYRSMIIIMALIFLMVFYLEGLIKTPLFPAILLGGFLLFFGMIAFMDKMPLSIQRSFSFLPIELDPMVENDAEGTTIWRLTVWKAVWPDVPKYLVKGKGFAYNGTDFYLSEQAVMRGQYGAHEPTLISGTYHNGWLTILIPFGIFGLITFLWFCGAALRVIYNNYRFGAPSLKLINTFLLAFFIARLAFYLTIYGEFELDLMLFTGLVGLSVALNGGVRQAKAKERLQAETATAPPIADTFTRKAVGVA